jgi:hypothetical protein
MVACCKYCPRFAEVWVRSRYAPRLVCNVCFGGEADRQRERHGEHAIPLGALPRLLDYGRLELTQHEEWWLRDRGIRTS